MQKYFKLLLFLLVYTSSLKSSFGQTDKILLPKGLIKFIPKGYVALDFAKGDLNLDEFQDVILILKKSNENLESDSDIDDRPLLILLGHADKSFTLSERNDNIVYCLDCGGIFGDPYDGITIKKGTFTVHHFGGSNDKWSNDISFKYSKTDKTWYLFKVVDKGWNVSDVYKIDSTVATVANFGVISFKKYKLKLD